MTTESIFRYVLIAVLGAFVVLIGLLMEQYSEQILPRNIKHFRWCKKIKLCGEWFVIVGVLTEFVVGIFSAIDSWQNEPLNQPIESVTATFTFQILGSMNQNPIFAAAKDVYGKGWICGEIGLLRNKGMADDLFPNGTNKLDDLICRNLVINNLPDNIELVEMKFERISTDKFNRFSLIGNKKRAVDNIKAIKLVLNIGVAPNAFRPGPRIEYGQVAIEINGSPIKYFPIQLDKLKKSRRAGDGPYVLLSQ